MLVRCPVCSYRQDAPPARGGSASLLMRCGSCGHSWIEPRPAEVIDVAPLRLPAPVNGTDDTDREVSRLVEAAREAEQAFAQRRELRRRNLRGWAIFGLMIAAVPGAAAFYPEPIVALAPSAARLYEKAGIKVNIYGLEIRKVEQKHIIDGGARVLAVKGEIWNIASSDRRIPYLRLALRDGSGNEVYSWLVESSARPLRAGEITTFTTRVSEPPEIAQNLEIRFARKSEISSTTAP
jgi:hypothetical protein